MKAIATRMILTAICGLALILLVGGCNQTASATSGAADALTTATPQATSVAMTQSTPSDPSALISQGDAAFQQHAWDDAIQDYEQAANMGLPRGKASTHGTLKYVLHRLSLVYEYMALADKSDQNYYSCAPELIWAVILDPSNTAANRLLVEVIRTWRAQDADSEAALAGQEEEREEEAEREEMSQWSQSSQQSSYSSPISPSDEQMAGSSASSTNTAQREALNEQISALQDEYRGLQDPWMNPNEYGGTYTDAFSAATQAYKNQADSLTKQVQALERERDSLN